MVSRVSLLPYLVVAALLVVSTTAAASFEFDIEVEDQGDAIAPGESRQLEVTVTTTATSDWVCPTGGTLTIDLSVDEAPDDGFEADISPSLTYSVESAVYSGNSGRWSGEETATFTPKITEDVNSTKLSHSYTIVASYPGEANGPQGCTEVPPGQEWDDAEGSADVSIEAAAPEEEEEEDDEDGEDGGDGETQEDAEESPAPFAGLLVLAAALVVALRRRH